MTSWLNKQKKQTLLDLSSEAGLKQSDDLRKDELIENLDGYLQQNATRLSRNTSFEPYFGTRRTPFKARSSSAAGLTSGDDGEVKSVVKARGRRTTKVKQEDDGEASGASPSQALVASTSALAARTPGRPNRTQLPPSPADVADDMEYAARRMSASIDDLYTDSGIPEIVDRVREMCSSVIGVQMTFLLLEGVALSRELLPLSQVSPTLIESRRILGLQTWPIAVYLPNLFQLLTADFWYPTLLWSATSIFIPLLVAYFYNLSIRDVKRHGSRVTIVRYRADPLTFNIAKALGALIVYNRGFTFGIVDPAYIVRVNEAMFGGHQGMLLGGYVGILAALYEAAQRK